MKIEQLIVQQLYKRKEVALQGIGIFRLRPDVLLPAEGEKDFSIPADAFSFEYNLKAQEDDALVDYIVQQTGKIKPLASSDLDSYAILAKQFLNLGKPLRIEGIGTVQKNQKGDYEFTAGQFINPKIDDIFKPVTERKKEEISFESESTANNKKRNLMIGLIITVLVFAGLALYYFLVLKNNGTKQVEQNPIAADSLKKDSAQMVALKNDTNKKSTVDSSKLIAPALPSTAKDISSFMIVLKEYSSSEAVQKAYKRLTNWGHKMQIVKADSTHYKLVMPFIKPLSDTARARDSVQRFFGGKPYVQL